MIFSKLDGTTSKKFRVGKNGVAIIDNNGTLQVEEHGGLKRSIGIANIRLSGVSQDIPTAGAVRQAIDRKIRTVGVGETPEDLQDQDYIFVEKPEGGN